MPFRLGGKRFRHETEYDYLCHLQAVVSQVVPHGSNCTAYVNEYFSWRGALDFNTHPFIFRLQVEILVKYEQLEYVLSQMSETTKKPRAGTLPLVAVPLRLDLTPEQVKKILR